MTKSDQKQFRQLDKYVREELKFESLGWFVCIHNAAIEMEFASSKDYASSMLNGSLDYSTQEKQLMLVDIQQETYVDGGEVLTRKEVVDKMFKQLHPS